MDVTVDIRTGISDVNVDIRTGIIDVNVNMGRHHRRRT
jgi:hypothetical protein